MPSKPRLKSTTIWALEDIIACARRARRAWRAANTRALHQLDAVSLAALNQLGDELAEIESLARDARQGRYQQNTS